MVDRQDPIINEVNLAPLIEHKRKLGITYTVLGNRTGLPYQRIYGLCVGRLDWRFEELRQVLSVLYLQPEDVLSDELILKGYYDALRDSRQAQGTETSYDVAAHPV